MIVPINGVNENSRFYNVGSAKNKVTRQVLTPAPEAVSVNSSIVFSQIPNIKFTGSYGGDNLNAYHNIDIETLPEIEQRKYRLTVSAAQDIERGDYLSAIKKKIHIADICRAQGKNEDVEKLLDGVWRLFRNLPKEQLIEAATVLSNF